MKRKSNGARGGLLRALFTLVAVLATMAFPAAAYAKGTTIRVTSVSASPGDVVEVPVVVEGSPGILGATLEIAYDEGLTLAGATNGEALSSLAMTKPGSLKSPCKFTWDGVELADSDVRDGQVLLLSFKVSDDAEPGKDLGVSVSGDAGSVLDGNLNAIDVTYESGVVSVANYIPGDLDGDKLVNSRDVIYARRHIVGGYEQTINVAAADVNDDLLVNSADVILMRRFITGGYGVELKRSRLSGGSGGGSEEPGPEPHKHTTEAIAAKNPTCTEDGNIAYWHCTGCDKYFSDEGCAAEIAIEDTVIATAGHTPVVDAAVAPTHTSTGLTEGSHCAVCGTVLKEQQIVPKLEADEYYITYDVANGDSYLAGLNITNPNKTSYYEGDSFKLTNLSVDGYRFLGWYDGAGDDATKVTRINADTAEDLELYAHWQAVQYQVQFESDVFIDTNTATYTVDNGLALPTPKLSNYIFVGWSDDNGQLYGKRIPEGTTGKIVLHANWTSERNKTYTNPCPSDPVITEEKVAFDGDGEHDVLLFAYEIGRIENVPLYTIKDFGRISEGGVQKSEELTYSTTTSQGTAETISNAVAKATTNSSNWTLSSGWNETTSVNEEWALQHYESKEQAETYCKSDSNNWNISNSKYGSSSTTNSSSSTDGWSSQVKVNGTNSSSASTGISIERGKKTAGELNGNLSFGGKVGATVGVGEGANVSAERNVGVGVGGKIGKEWSNSSTQSGTLSGSQSRGFEAGSSKTHTGTSSSSSTNTSGWNNTSSYGGSSTTSKSNTVSTAVSDAITQKTGYGKSYTGYESETQGLATSSTDSETNSYTSAVTFNTATSESVTRSYSTSATKDGYHRWVVAGTAHVFGVVGYDMNTKSFFVYTYSIMDDATYEFEDYSNITADFNDNENGVINFEVPYDEVMEVVSDRVYSSDGLKVDMETGTVVEYTGEDTCVCIPEYYNAGHGDNVKITGIAPSVFSGNTDLVTVILSDYITDIPDGAFAGCTSLAFVGGNGVTTIGASAFSGCVSLEDCGVFSQVTHLGDSAFEGTDHLYVNAANPQVVSAAIASGTKSLQLNLRYLEDSEDVLDGVELKIPSSVDYFELNGNERTFNGLRVNSDAKETVFNKVNIHGSETKPVQLSSPKLALNQTNITAPGIATMLTSDSLEAVFNQSSITSPGIALAVTADSARVGLRGTTTISSTGPNAMVCRNVSLYETAADVVGKLAVPQRLLVCGDMDGMGYLQCSKVQTIDEATFNALLNTHKVYFDAGEGTCEETSRDLVYGEPIGELPVPTRDFCDFEGWYFKDNDQLVTAETVLPVVQDVTLVAKWKELWTTEIPNGVYSIKIANNTGYAVEVTGSEEGNVGSIIQLYRTDDALCQRFRFEANEDGSYCIVNPFANLVLEPTNELNSSGNPRVQLSEPQALDSQRWFVCKKSDGEYYLINKGNGLFIGINGAVADKTRIQCVGKSDAATFTLNKERYAVYEYGGYTWREAKSICEQAGGHLASITSANEQNIINAIIQNGIISRNCFWLGGYREGDVWKWVTGEQFTFTNWAPGQPDHQDEDKLMNYRRIPDNTSDSLRWNNIQNNPAYDNAFYALGNFGFFIEWEDGDTALTSQSDGNDYIPQANESDDLKPEMEEPVIIQENDVASQTDEDVSVVIDSEETSLEDEPSNDALVIVEDE